MIAIVGAGLSGSYLARRLVVEGLCKPKELKIFDNPTTKAACGITPCGWATSLSTLSKACELLELEPEAYLLTSWQRVRIAGVDVKVKDLCTFHKPRFVRDCLEDLQFAQGLPKDEGFEVVVDATASRKLLSPAEQIWAYAAQLRLSESPRFAEFSPPLASCGVGYSWRFPLGREGCHVGVGFFDGLPKLHETSKALCSCRGEVRISTPKRSKPIVERKGRAVILAVGESSGTVSPLLGSGIKESIQGLEILMDCWRDWESYAEKLEATFGWAEEEFRVVEKLRSGRNLGLRDFRVLKQSVERYGAKVSVKAMLRCLGLWGS